jgi:hypothetical protein
MACVIASPWNCRSWTWYSHRELGMDRSKHNGWRLQWPRVHGLSAKNLTRANALDNYNYQVLLCISLWLVWYWRYSGFGRHMFRKDPGITYSTKRHVCSTGFGRMNMLVIGGYIRVNLH